MTRLKLSANVTKVDAVCVIKQGAPLRRLLHRSGKFVTLTHSIGYVNHMTDEDCVLDPGAQRHYYGNNRMFDAAASTVVGRSIAKFAVGGNVKRSFDVLSSLFIFVVFLPLIFIVAVLVKLADPGPIFFRHTRVGCGGRRFQCLKFRTMVANSDEVLRRLLDSDPEARQEWEHTQKLAKDPRITPIGKFLRQSSMDELPQLINVMRGDMSLVGPRPVIPGELKRYGDKLNLYLNARPGITGIWQVSGRSDCAYDERVEMDADYVRNWRFSKDFVILLRTLAVVVARTGSY